MLGDISPIRPPKEDGASRSERIKPAHTPRDDRFRKSMRNRSQSVDSHEEHPAIDEREETPSLFDLSKSKTKNKSSNGKMNPSFSQNSASGLAPNRPLMAKQERDSSQEQDQEDSNSSTLTASDEGMTTASTQMLQPEAEDHQSPLSKPLPPPNNLSLMGLPQPKSFGRIKEPIQQSPPNLLNIAKPPKKEMAAVQQPQKSKKLNEEEETIFNSEQMKSEEEELDKREESNSSVVTQGKEEEATNTTPNTAPNTATNMTIATTGFQTERSQILKGESSAATIREIATQIVDRIQVMRKDHETQTTVTLRQPPILEGATMTLIASDNAKREFNIAFANLSPEAKLLLDRKFKEGSLSEILVRKGIIVHMITTSTQVETPFATDASQNSRDRQEQEQQQQQEQQRRQKFQELEEGEVT